VLVFALFPRMHLLWRYFKSVLTVDGETKALWDEDYRFETKTFSVFEPITLRPGVLGPDDTPDCTDEVCP
jgi:hypothetical protein